MMAEQLNQYEASVRLFRGGDEACLLTIQTNSILSSKHCGYTNTELESWVSGLNEDGYVYLVLSGAKVQILEIAEKGPIGYCSRRENEILGLYVSPTFQRLGFGRSLLESSETGIRDAGFRQVKLIASLISFEFYRKHGYSKQSETHICTRGGLKIRAFQMGRELTE